MIVKRPFRSGRLAVLIPAVAVVLAAGIGPGRALTDEEIFREFQFGTMPAGARPQAMGGAFIATADDASALLANPAGLQFVTGFEAFVEFRGIDQDTRITSSNFGSLDVDPVTGARDLPYLGLTSVSDPDTVGEMSFLGVAYPFRLGRKARRLNVAAARQVLASWDLSLGSDTDVTGARFSFDSFPNTVSGGEIVAYSVETQVTGGGTGEIIAWNVGASYEVHPDFSIGATVSLAELDLQSNTVTRVIDPLELFVDPSHPRLPAQQTTDFFETCIDGTDSDVTFTIGIHLHPDSVFSSGRSPWQFGAVYRKGAKFSVPESTFLNEVPDQTFENRVVLPDSYGLALSYRTREHWTFTAEADRVELSDMLDGFVSGVNVLTSDRVAGGAFGTDPNVEVTYDIDDENVYRAGAEYARPLGGRADRLLQLWGGYFHTPDNRIRMTVFNSTDPDVNSVYLDAFRGAESVDHFTAGAGMTFGAHAIRIAGETSDLGGQIIGNYIFKLAGRTGKAGSPAPATP